MRDTETSARAMLWIESCSSSKNRPGLVEAALAMRMPSTVTDVYLALTPFTMIQRASIELYSIVTVGRNLRNSPRLPSVIVPKAEDGITNSMCGAKRWSLTAMSLALVIFSASTIMGLSFITSPATSPAFAREKSCVTVCPAATVTLTVCVASPPKNASTLASPAGTLSRR